MNLEGDTLTICLLNLHQYHFNNLYEMYGFKIPERTYFYCRLAVIVGW